MRTVTWSIQSYKFVMLVYLKSDKTREDSFQMFNGYNDPDALWISR